MYLCGAGGHAKVIIDILEANNIIIEGLYDINESKKTILGYSVFHTMEMNGPLIISVGDNRRRKIIALSANIEFGQAIHPSAIISNRANIGVGTVVMQGSIVQSCAHIGNHCIINSGASVDHDCVIDDFAHISPHATLCGQVMIKEGAWIGANATILPGIVIGKWSVVGAGSIVTKDIPDHVIAFGSPCKIVKRKENNSN